MAILAETRRGPKIPDLLHDWFPYIRSLDWYNSYGWFSLLIFSWLILLLFEKRAALLYLKTGALLSILRGVFIPLTNLGPPLGGGASPAIQQSLSQGWDAGFFLNQFLPVGIFWGAGQNSAFYLTQDLFFSGHTAVTFLLALLPVEKRWIKIFFVMYHLLTVAVLLLTRIHYSIDIFAAYFFVLVLLRFTRNGFKVRLSENR